MEKSRNKWMRGRTRDLVERMENGVEEDGEEVKVEENADEGK